jgi:hypothetical protein
MSKLANHIRPDWLGTIIHTIANRVRTTKYQRPVTSTSRPTFGDLLLMLLGLCPLYFDTKGIEAPASSFFLLAGIIMVLMIRRMTVEPKMCNNFLRPIWWVCTFTSVLCRMCKESFYQDLKTLIRNGRNWSGRIPRLATRNQFFI